MSKYLDDFLLTMPETQRQKLMDLLEIKQKDGVIKSDFELRTELERLLKDLDKRAGQPTFTVREQYGQTNSANHNKNFDEILFDLTTLFQASDTIERLLKDNHQLSRALLSDIRKKVQLIKSDVERYKLLLTNTDGFLDGVHEQFKVPQYTETNPDALLQLRTDRYGRYYNEIYAGDITAGALQLSATSSIDQLHSAFGSKIAKIQVKNRVGNAATNDNHKIDFAVDGSAESFWAESVLVDDVIVQDISDLWSHDYHDYPKDGALCEIEITLDGIQTVSEFHFDPYCSYPLEIVSIVGYESGDLNSKMYTLVSPAHENSNQRSKKSVDVMSFQFPSVDIAQLRVLIRQENYVKEHYLVNKDEMLNQEMWQKISASDAPLADTIQPGETIAELDFKNQITGWNRYLTALKQWAGQQGDKGKSAIDAAKNALDVIKSGNYQNPMKLTLESVDPKRGKAKVFTNGVLSQEWQPVSKHEYVYGAYDISVRGRKYHPHSIHVTKPLPLSGNVKSISLSTEEVHHQIEVQPGDMAKITDVEYYISAKKNPDSASWFPILPTNQAYVDGELLVGSTGEDNNELIGMTQFSFRFPVVSSETVQLRRDGAPMATSTYKVSSDGKKIGIYPEYYSGGSMYTVSYKPIDQAYIVNIDETTGILPVQYIDANGETGELFEKADENNLVTLQHNPYLYRKELLVYDLAGSKYTQDDKKLQIDSPYYPVNVRVNGQEFKNITNYANGSYDQNRLDTENGGKTFAQIGNQIIFSKQAGPLKNITVDYFYLTSDIRLKAILRRNHAAHESISPQVFSFNLKSQTYDLEVQHV